MRPVLILRRVLLSLWLLLGLALLFVLAAQRYGEAKEVAEVNTIARDLAGRVRYEALRKPREILQELAERGPAEMAFTPEELVQRARPLAATGFIITVKHRRGDLVQAAPAPASVPAVGPNVLTVQGARYLAGVGPNKIPGDAFLFPAAYQDKVAIGRVLGVKYTSDIHAAIVVGKAALQRAAQGVLLPGVELAFYNYGVRQVNLARGTGTSLDLDLARERVPEDVLQADDAAIDLSRGSEWPGFLLRGGNELGGVQLREEERRGKAHHAVYLRDFGSRAEHWNGIGLAYLKGANTRREPWSTGHVLAGLLAYLLLAALILRATRRRETT